MLLAETIYKHEIEADLIPFRNLLLGVFFVSVGLQIDPHLVGEKILLIVLLLGTVMLTKCILLLSILIAWQGKKTALKTAITFSQMGEFSLVVFSLLSSARLLDPSICQTVIVTAVASMILTPFLIQNADRLARLLTRETPLDTTIPTADVIGEHVILCGFDGFGRSVSENLDQAGINHVVLTDDTDDYVSARKADKNVVFGNAADRTLLERLNIRKAISTIVMAHDLDRIKEITASISMIDPELKVMAKVLSEEEMEEFDSFNHELVVDGNRQAAGFTVDRIRKSRMLAEETARLQFLADFSPEDPRRCIELLLLEQGRLLDLMSSSFDALRKKR